MDMSIIISLIIIPFLLALSAFFASSETAITSASRPKLYHLGKKGAETAEIVQHLQNNISRVIGTLLFGNTLTNVFITALATGIFVELLGEAGVAVSTVIIGSVIVIYTEVMPKIYAIHHAEQTALRVAPWVQFFVKLCQPITTTFDFVAIQTLKLFRVRIHPMSTAESDEEELLGAIEMHAPNRDEAPQEKAMMRSILELWSVSVEQIMTHRKNMVMIDADMDPRDIVNQILSCPYTRLPVWRGNPDENIIGVIHAKAVLRAIHNFKGDIGKIDIEALASKPWFIPETTSLHDQLQAFRERREHFAIVVDEYGALMGIVTLEDVLEEIVGDIIDEYDVSTMGVRPQADNSFMIDGTVPIRDLNRQFDWDLPDDEAATLAGLLLHETRQIPEIGQVFMIQGFRFEVMRRQRNQITLIRLLPPQKDQKPLSEGI